MFKTATRSTLHQDVLNQLYEAFEKETWSPGAKLPGEQALAEKFDVSRNSVREALKVLANRGIVVSRPGSGTYLTENSKSLLHSAQMNTYIFEGINLKELIETRCLIEGQTAYHAAEKGTDEDFCALELLLVEGDDLKTKHNVHVQFHAKLAQISGRKLLERILGSLQYEIDIQRERYMEYYTETLNNMMYNHSHIIHEIKSRDPRRAQRAMIEHIRSVWSSIFTVTLDI